MRIYQSAIGSYILLLDDNSKLYFDSESEAIQHMNKLSLAKALVYRVQQLIQTMDNGPDVVQEYYDAGGASIFSDSDVESLGLTATEVLACVTLLEQFANFTGNEEVVKALYRSTINKVRRVDAS